MRSELFSGMTKIITALKVAALVSVLGAVVLAAEHRLGAAPEPTDGRPPMAAPDSKADRGGGQAKDDYFRSHFPVPSDRVAERPPTS